MAPQKASSSRGKRPLRSLTWCATVISFAAISAGASFLGSPLLLPKPFPFHSGGHCQAFGFRHALPAAVFLAKSCCKTAWLVNLLQQSDGPLDALFFSAQLFNSITRAARPSNCPDGRRQQPPGAEVLTLPHRSKWVSLFLVRVTHRFRASSVALPIGRRQRMDLAVRHPARI